MRFSYVKLRVPVDRVPEMSGVFSDADVFAAPKYELWEHGTWVRLKHVESGKQLAVPANAVLCTVVLTDEQPKQFKQHMGKR